MARRKKKGLSWQQRKKRAKALRERRHKMKIYYRLRDDWIRHQAKKGRKFSKGMAVQSGVFKNIIRDLKSKNPKKVRYALYRVGRFVKRTEDGKTDYYSGPEVFEIPG